MKVSHHEVHKNIPSMMGPGKVTVNKKKKKHGGKKKGKKKYCE